MCNQSPIMITSVSSNVFQNIASNVNNIANGNINTNPCPDQYVGIINIEKNGCVSDWNVGWEKDSIFIKDKTNRQSNSDTLQNKDMAVLAIVLESPHKDEFDNNQAIGPAIGTTGDNIEKYLPEVLFNYLPSIKVDNKIYYAPEDQISNDTYKVLLINAIQYQCSLGEDTKLYRDKIFSEMWKQANVNQDFIKRLESHKPKVVINCCTKGDFKDTEKDKHLRELVQNEINKYCKGKNILKLRAAHPSSLHFRNGLSKVEKEDK